jgi:hypothetical protein
MVTDDRPHVCVEFVLMILMFVLNLVDGLCSARIMYLVLMLVSGDTVSYQLVPTEDGLQSPKHCMLYIIF